jgi:hypothetical protein
MCLDCHITHVSGRCTLLPLLIYLHGLTLPLPPPPPPPPVLLHGIGVAEHKHIRETYAVHRFDVGYHHYIWAKFQCANQFFLAHGLQSFSQLFCIGRAMVYPTYDSIDTMEKLTNVRADIDVQFIMFNNCMNAARQVKKRTHTYSRSGAILCYAQNRTFYQDRRLGTNIGQTQQKR